MIPLQFIKHDDVEKEAELLIFNFMPGLLESAQSVNTDLLLEYLSDTEGLKFDIASIDSEDGEPIAGQYWPNEHRIVINRFYFDSHDLVKQRISRFTEGHEIGHALIHRCYYYKDNRQKSLFEDSTLDQEMNRGKLVTLQRTVESGTFHQSELSEEEITRERQANVFSAALLIPQKPLRNCVCEMFGHSDFVFKKAQSKDYEETLDTVSRRLNDTFNVNPIVMRIRLKRLKIVCFDEGSLLL